MIIFLSGEDTFRSRQQLKKMVEKFKKDRDPQGYNVTVLDCVKTEEAQILEQTLAIPFLAEKRLIVLENLLSAPKRQFVQEEILKRIKEKKLPETNIIVFWEGEGKPKTNVAKELQDILNKEKYAQSFEILTGTKLNAWISQEIKERDGKINLQALQYLANNTRGDIWRLNSLIDQLAVYKQNEEIKLADVQLFLDEKTDDNIFNLVDAIVGKLSKQIFQMMREQYKKGEDPQYILSMILRQIKILLEMRDLYDHEDSLTSEQIAKKLEIHPFVAKKSLPLVKRYSYQELKNIYQNLLEIDIKTKTGQGDQSLLLDLFVGKLV